MRITLDTNQFLRALMRPPELATFIMAWQARRFTVVCSKQLLDEYESTLIYPKIAKLIFPELRRIFLTQLKDEMEIVDLPHIDPVCRDPDDDKIIATAIYGNVDYLATTDDDLQVEPVISIIRTQGIHLTTIDEILMLLP
ncbi:MAG: putative toxin-antitoxin system toxin component, PIN family [Caldilineaceae bacterium]